MVGKNQKEDIKPPSPQPTFVIKVKQIRNKSMNNKI